MVDVFDEVEEELRKERWQTFLKTYGPWILGAALAVVVGVAGYEGFKAWRDGAQTEASERFVEAQLALEAGALDEAAAGFSALAEDGPRGYAALALMQRAAVELELGNGDAAARLYEQAAERAPDALTRDVARYKGVLAAWDGLSYDDIELRLDPLTEGAAPFGALARELMGAAALRDERWDAARSHYNAVALSVTAPPGAQRRAQEALALIALQAPEGDAGPMDAAAEPAPASPEENGS